MRLENDEVIMMPSIGIATFPDDGDEVQILMKNADLAMYFAKHSGPNSFQYHQDSMNTTNRSGSRWRKIRGRLSRAMSLRCTTSRRQT